LKVANCVVEVIQAHDQAIKVVKLKRPVGHKRLA
jgi:hypothetical protein